MKAAIYARVSGKAKGAEGPEDKKRRQDTENQLVQLRRYAKAQGWEVIEFVDRESGKTSNRSAFQEMFLAASRRQVGVVLVWALDRLSREGVLKTFQHVQRLADYGCRFESYTEPFFRTTGAAGELLMAVLSWVAKQERLRISERTKAGLARARAKGRIGGRPHRVWDRQRALKLRTAGWSWRRLERELGIAQSSIRKGIAGLKPSFSAPKPPVPKTSLKKRRVQSAKKGVKKRS